MNKVKNNYPYGNGWMVGNCILEWTCQILPELQTKLSAINQIDHKLLLNRSRVGFGLARIYCWEVIRDKKIKDNFYNMSSVCRKC